MNPQSAVVKHRLNPVPMLIMTLLGLSRSELARLVGGTSYQLSRTLAGLMEVPDHELRQIAAHLCISPGMISSGPMSPGDALRATAAKWADAGGFEDALRCLRKSKAKLSSRAHLRVRSSPAMLWNLPLAMGFESAARGPPS